MGLEIGDAAPADRLTTDQGEAATLRDHTGRKVVVFFYPKAMTPGCTAEACGFRDNYGQFQEAGFEIVGVSPDPPSDNAASANGTTSRSTCSVIPTTRWPASWAPGASRRTTARSTRA